MAGRAVLLCVGIAGTWGKGIALPGTPVSGGGVGVGLIVASSSANRDVSLLSRHVLLSGSLVLQASQERGLPTRLTAAEV